MKTKHVLLRRRAKTILLLLSTATLLAAAPAARADSASDLMEQGIYSEETKGDLDSAVQLYKKVIAQAKADQALAAQAQYHLGLCYYKQKNYTDANTAFETLVKDYPDQKDTVALARKYLAGAHPLQPAPWSDGEDMRLEVKLAGGLKIGVADYRMNSGQTTNGQKIWRCSSHVVAAGNQSVSHAEVDADTFSPIHSVWKHTLLGEVNAVYYPDHADLKTTGKEEVRKLDFNAPVIDNEETIEWMRRLPMADGFKIDQPILASLSSLVVPIKLEVSGPEKVEVPAGTYNCYKVELSIAQTFWYSSDTNRYLVKVEAGGAIMELTGVTHCPPGEKAAYADVTNGFSLTAPAGWFFDPQEGDTKGTTKVRIIDPQGLTDSFLMVRTLDSLKPEEKKSLRDAANLRIAQAEEAKTLKDLQIRPNSWKDRTIAGKPAISYIGDYTAGKSKNITYGVSSFGESNEVVFVMHTAARDFDALQPQMDAIIDSYKTR
jgi:tetratricopeptide (TPR) repeat protein